jgi:LysR family transcriptional regulator (chromosome initiation inhibitor)
MLDYKLIDAFAAVIDEGGFERAARRLHLTQSAVSQRVRLLEERFGQSLVVRTTPVRATGAGQRLLQHYRQVRSLEDELAGALDLADAGGYATVPLAINSDTMATWFVNALAPLLAREHLLLDVSVTDQDETHNLLRDGRVIGCISSRAEAMQGCHCHYLGHMDYYCCATPAFAARWFPDRLTAAAARRAPALSFNRNDALHERFLAPLGLARGDFPVHYIPDSSAFLAACLQGVAYALLPRVQAETYLGSGQLVDLSPGRLGAVQLYWHHWNLHTQLLQRLTAAFHTQARSSLRQEPAGRGTTRGVAASDRS